MIHIRPVIIIYDSQAASEARRIEQSKQSELVTRHEKSRVQQHSCWIQTREHETGKKSCGQERTPVDSRGDQKIKIIISERSGCHQSQR